MPRRAARHALGRVGPDGQPVEHRRTRQRGQANYSAAKAGLQGFTRTLALELGRYGITVNSVAPGYTITDMTRSTAARIGVTIEELSQEVVAAIPVGRAGQPEDIAHAVAYFCDERSGFVTGQVLYVAGGPRG